MKRPPEHMLTRYAVALCASVVLHLLVLTASAPLLLATTDPKDFPPPKPAASAPSSRQVVPLMSAEEVDRLIALAQKRPPPVPKRAPPTTPKPKVEVEKPKGQVVEIPPPPREEVPDKARLLSDYNSKVDKEMVSATNAPPQPAMTKSDRKLISPGDDAQGSAKAQRRKSSKKASRFAPEKRDGTAERPGKTPGERVKKASKVSKTAKPSKAKLVEGDGPFSAGGEKPEEQTALNPGDGGGPMGGAPEPESWRALLPTLGPEDLARKDGSIDHIDNVDKGNQTFLNTRDYKYAWFFNRVKRGVQRRWRAVDAHRRNDPYGRIHGVRDRRTEVEVTLSSTGQLEDIIVLKDSGVVFLDDAAVTAFEEAAPFPNPPDGLKDADGKIRFRFAFFLEIDSRGLRFLPRRRR